ncbi:MAG: DUF4065 domain-containing protein [Bacteroidetes bacterium]|nr:MAG: DUF4065 domain-containing protein [Bacteroidota bacterium]
MTPNKSPFTGGEVLLVQEWVERAFRKEAFGIWEHYYVCKDTGRDFSNQDLDELNVQQVYNLYRSRHHIPFPDEIRHIREQYGLSAAKMSELLDLGTNSYRLYESGEMPSLANARLVRLAADPEQFRIVLEENRSLFSDAQYKKVMGRTEALLIKDKLTDIFAYLWNFHPEANEFTGFVKPDFQKVAQFVLFFAQEARPLKTRMNKLLFYCDFLHFKRTGFSISGCNYRAIPFGPVPSHFHELFGILEAEKYISIEQELFEHGTIGERFAAAQNFKPELFTEKELAHMREIVASFQDIRTQKLIEISHDEKGWAENQQSRSLISYQQYAFHLKGI